MLEPICWWLLCKIDFTRPWMPACILRWVWKHANIK